MKENILNRIQKYYTGGPDDLASKAGKGLSLGLKAVKPFFTGAVSRMAGPLGLMLGANKLNANEYNSNANPLTMPSGNTMDNIMTALPSGSPQVDINSVNTEMGNIMNPYKKKMGGLSQFMPQLRNPIVQDDNTSYVDPNQQSFLNKVPAMPSEERQGMNRFSPISGLQVSGMGSNVGDPGYGYSLSGKQRTEQFKQGIGDSFAAQEFRMGGVEPLPGGLVQPIPGSDAVEFVGASHDDGGIMVDRNTEVEGGETMDKVVMNKGGAKDYFFSDHLKKGGMSYAQQHKNILQNGGGQQEINMLAKMQEKAANRDPKQVAKLGGVMKYEEGGLSDLEKAQRLSIMLQNNPEYNVGPMSFTGNPDVQDPRQSFGLPTKMQLESPYSPYNRQQQINDLTPYNQMVYGNNYSRVPVTSPIETQQPLNFTGTPTFSNFGNNPLDLDKRNFMDPLNNVRSSIPLQQIPNELPDPVLAQATDINEGIPKFISAGPGRMDYIKNPDYYEGAAASSLNDAGIRGMSQDEVNLAKGTTNTYSAYLARTEMSGEIPEGGILSEKQWNKQQRKFSREMNPAKGTMPLESKIAAAAQFLPAIGALLTKQKDLEEYKYEPGFTAPIVAGTVKGQTYTAPNQNEARARLAAAYTGEQNFINTSGAGSASFANRQALFAKKLAAEGTLGAQESKDQIQAENLTKKSAEQANVRNVQNELTAATTNAQMIQREADRRSAIESANVQLKNMRQNEKISNRINLLTNLGQGVAGVMGDQLTYKSGERLAKSFGADGIYERDQLFNYMKTLPENQGVSDEEIRKKMRIITGQ